MNLTHEHIAALRALQSLTPQERMAAMWEQDQQDLHDAERAKNLPLAHLTSAQWEDFKIHVLDGGGAHDAQRVVRALLQAVLDDDQDTFWPELVHLLKSAGKHLGVINVQGGQVSLSGIGPTPKEIQHVGG